MEIERMLTKAIEDHFGADTKRINHAKRVLGFAKELLSSVKADENIVIPASILHDVGIKTAEQKYGSPSGYYQQIEGPPIARAILEKIGYDENAIKEICEIIAHHHTPGKINTLNFKVLYDSDWLVNLEEEGYTKDPAILKKRIGTIFLTEEGKKIAERIYSIYG